MAWLQSWLWVPGIVLLLCFLPLYFPNGRLFSRRWRWVVRLALFFCVTGAALSALSPGEIQNEGIVNPLGIEALRPVSDLLEPVVVFLHLPTPTVRPSRVLVEGPRARKMATWQMRVIF